MKFEKGVQNCIILLNNTTKILLCLYFAVIAETSADQQATRTALFTVMKTFIILTGIKYSKAQRL